MRAWRRLRSLCWDDGRWKFTVPASACGIVTTIVQPLPPDDLVTREFVIWFLTAASRGALISIIVSYIIAMLIPIEEPPWGRQNSHERT